MKLFITWTDQAPDTIHLQNYYTVHDYTETHVYISLREREMKG